jgi:transposase-like protein
VCHTVLQSPRFFSLLIQIDADTANQMHGTACPLCGAGVLHRANYPRKPKACPSEVLHDYQSRWSFCCHLCRRRCTPMSVRFLGRRVYVALAVVVLAVKRNKINAAITALVETLGVPERTVARWRQWWLQHFACTALWQEMNARFMPPVQIVDLPLSLIERFTGAPHEAMLRFLTFLSPLSVPT